MQCPSCRHVNQAGSSFCCNCGTILDEQPLSRDAKRRVDSLLAQDGYTAEAPVSEDMGGTGQVLESSAHRLYLSGTEQIPCPNCYAMNARDAVLCIQCATSLMLGVTGTVQGRDKSMFDATNQPVMSQVSAQLPFQTTPRVDPRVDKDDTELRFISRFYYVMGAVYGVFAFFFGIFMLLGLFEVAEEWASGTADFVGVIISLFFLLFFAVQGALNVLAGRWIAKRRHWRLCFIIGIICVLTGGVGILVGIWTIRVLRRSAVQAKFNASLSM